MLELFKDGDNMAIRTDAKTELAFIEEISQAFEILISNNRFEGNWEFQFRYWLPQLVDICCAYRNYKNNVSVQKVFITGEYYPLAKNSVLVVGRPEELEKINGCD